MFKNSFKLLKTYKVTSPYNTATYSKKIGQALLQYKNN